MQPDLAVCLILIAPLLGAVLNGLGGLAFPGFRHRERVIGLLATICVAVPFLAALSLFVSFDAPSTVHLFRWMSAGELNIAFDYRVDQLSLIMTLIITGVGSLIHVYATGYM